MIDINGKVFIGFIGEKSCKWRLYVFALHIPECVIPLLFRPSVLCVFGLVLVMSSSRCLVWGEVFWVEYVAGLSEHSLRAHPVPESFFGCGHPQAHVGLLVLYQSTIPSRDVW